MTQKLNQVLAIERTTKSKATSELTKLHRSSTNSALFNGFSRTYEKLDEDSEEQPPQSNLVQLKADETLKRVERTLTDLFDVTATKDSANQAAKSSVSVDGKEILTDVPATTLLFLEKQLHDLHTFVAKMPTLDPSHDWTRDDATNLWKSSEQKTTRTKKVAKPIVLYPATEQHPAQTQLVQEDVVVGHWKVVQHSGAFTESRKALIVERIEKLQKAVKYAREAANGVPAPEVSIGSKVFGYLFA